MAADRQRGGTLRKRGEIALAIICLSLGFCGGLAEVRAQDAASQAGVIWKEARNAFGSGNYTLAAHDFNSIIVNSDPAALTWADATTESPRPPLGKWLEPTFFMLGSSYYDARDWPNAIQTFKRYLKLFPEYPHFTEIRFSLAEAELWGGQPAEAIPIFTSLLPAPAYHEKCVLLLAQAYKQAGNIPGAIALFEKEKDLPNLDPDFLGKIKIRLLGLYQDHSDVDRAVALLQEIDADLSHIQDITVFNALAVRLGDTFLGRNKVSPRVRFSSSTSMPSRSHTCSVSGFGGA